MKLKFSQTVPDPALTYIELWGLQSIESWLGKKKNKRSLQLAIQQVFGGDTISSVSILIFIWAEGHKLTFSCDNSRAFQHFIRFATGLRLGAEGQVLQ